MLYGIFHIMLLHCLHYIYFLYPNYIHLNGEQLTFAHIHRIIGKYNYIARRNSLYNVEVGNYCCFGPDVHIGGMQHSYWWYSMSPLLSEECKAPDQTIIGNDVWIGAQVVIKQGVKIGDGAVIGANSFVNKDVEPFSIVVGSPAKHLKYRFDKETQDKIRNSSYWDEKPEKAKQILNTFSHINY